MSFLSFFKSCIKHWNIFNFLFLVKNLTVTSYGVYSSIIGVSMLFAGLVTSVFTTQMIAVTSKKSDFEIKNLSIEYFYMQNIVFVLALFFSFLTIFFKVFSNFLNYDYLIIFSLLIAWGAASKDLLTSRSF